MGSICERNFLSQSLLNGSLVRKMLLSLLSLKRSAQSLFRTVPFPLPSMPSIAIRNPFMVCVKRERLLLCLSFSEMVWHFSIFQVGLKLPLLLRRESL